MKRLSLARHVAPLCGVLGLCAATLLPGFTQAQTPPPAAATARPAIDPAVANALRAMGATIASANALTLRMVTLREMPFPTGQSVLLESTAAVALRRPGQFAAVIGSDMGSLSLWYDGRALSVLSPAANAYATLPFTGDIEAMLKLVETRLAIDLPLQPLMTQNPGQTLLEGATSAVRVGPTMVRGVACEHFALRNPQADWEIWISGGIRPLPCRVSVVDRTIAGNPRMTIEFEDWDLAPRLADADFVFTPPPNATSLSFLDRSAQPTTGAPR